MTDIIDVGKTLARYMFQSAKTQITIQASLGNDGCIKVFATENGKEIDTDWFDREGAEA